MDRHKEKKIWTCFVLSDIFFTVCLLHACTIYHQYWKQPYVSSRYAECSLCTTIVRTSKAINSFVRLPLVYYTSCVHFLQAKHLYTVCMQTSTVCMQTFSVCMQTSTVCMQTSNVCRQNVYCMQTKYRLYVGKLLLEEDLQNQLIIEHSERDQKHLVTYYILGSITDKRAKVSLKADAMDAQEPLCSLCWWQREVDF